MELIKASNISFSYDDKVDALHCATFSFEEGKSYAVIGHNGSGKSTLAKILIGLLKASDGEITAFDLPYNSKNIKEIRSRLGIIFQNPDNQFIGASVRDDIAFGLENRRVPTKKMEGIIQEFSKEVGMEDYLDYEPSSLSGGQKQRVAIAGVLSMHPDVIILDEATSMLDPKGKKEVLDLIAKLRKENPKLTLISITHDIEEAFSHDEIIVMNRGRVVLRGDKKEVLEHSDILESCRLDIPFMYKLANDLDSIGVKIDPNKSIEEVAKDICR